MWWQHAIFWMFLGLLATNEGSKPHYEYKQGNGRYYAVEHGHLLTFVEVSILETSTPFNSWAELLLEPCDMAEQTDPEAPLCWPKQKHERTQGLLASLYCEAPDYRGKPGLLHVATYLNRDMGTFRRAWIVGTDPLIVAFLDGPPNEIPPKVQRLIDEMQMFSRPGARATTRPTTRPGFFEVVTSSGEVIPVDHRVRDAHLVSDVDLETQVDRILIYPQNMPFTGAGSPERKELVKVVRLPEPRSVKEVMRALTESGKLEREAKEVTEVPVLLHP